MKTVTKTLSIAVLTAAFISGPALVSTPSFDFGAAHAATAHDKEMQAKHEQEVLKKAEDMKKVAMKHMQVSKELNEKAHKMHGEAQHFRQELAKERAQLHKMSEEGLKIMHEGKMKKNGDMVKKGEALMRKVKEMSQHGEQRVQDIQKMAHEARQLEMKSMAEHKQATALMAAAQRLMASIHH